MARVLTVARRCRAESRRYGPWGHPAHPQLSRWLTLYIDSSLRPLPDGDWIGNEEPANVTPYKRGPRRH